jgi:hypothetical protein
MGAEDCLMPAKATTVQEYLESLPTDRRAAIADVRRVILERLPPGYEEASAAGMLTYQVPLSVLPDTYNGHPLWYIALASQKNYMTVHLMPLYADAKAEQAFRAQVKARGKKLDMGKACVRFKSVDDLALDAIGDVVAKYSVETWVSVYRQSRKTAPAPKKATRAAAGTRAARARAR